MSISSAATTPTPPVNAVTEAVVSLSGDVLRPFSISADEIREMANVLAEPFDMHCFTTNRFIRKFDRYRGVLLRDLIVKAGLRAKCEGDFKRTVFLAIAHDGYAVTFSWHELFNTPVGDRVLIACECGGQPLGEDQGAPILFSGADIFPAPRHVKGLASIVTRVLDV